MSDELLIDRADSIVTVTFNRPKALNAFTFDMYERLAALCSEIDAETSTRALILTGAGPKAFAAGTDIAQFQTFESDADALAYEALIETVLSALERCRVPTIAAIAGVCAAGGAAIAACCDLRIGARNMRFGFPIARTLGNCLSQANLARLVALVGEARVKEMLFTACLYDAEQALSLGLICEIVGLSDLIDAAHVLAAKVAAHAPLTIDCTKKGLARLRQPTGVADPLLWRCYSSEDFREGIAAFLEKRRPRWTGR